MKVLPYMPRVFLEEGKVHVSVGSLSVVKACNPVKTGFKKREYIGFSS